MATSIAAACTRAGLDAAAALGTTLLTLAASTALVGLGLMAVARLRLAGAVNFVPLPAVGGYLGYVGARGSSRLAWAGLLAQRCGLEQRGARVGACLRRCARAVQRVEPGTSQASAALPPALPAPPPLPPSLQCQATSAWPRAWAWAAASSWAPPPPGCSCGTRRRARSRASRGGVASSRTCLLLARWTGAPSVLPAHHPHSSLLLRRSRCACCPRWAARRC